MTQVTLYEQVNFQGRATALGVGSHRLFGQDDMNDMASSLRVPPGMVAAVYEHADTAGGYGLTADFMEDCADLADLSVHYLNDEISYISVIVAEQPSGLVWARGRLVNGAYVPGHWGIPALQ